MKINSIEMNSIHITSISKMSSSSIVMIGNAVIIPLQERIRTINMITSHKEIKAIKHSSKYMIIKQREIKVAPKSTPIVSSIEYSIVSRMKKASAVMSPSFRLHIIKYKI